MLQQINMIYRSNQYDLLLRSAATDAENGHNGASFLPLYIILIMHRQECLAKERKREQRLLMSDRAMSEKGCSGEKGGRRMAECKF